MKQYILKSLIRHLPLASNLCSIENSNFVHVHIYFTCSEETGKGQDATIWQVNKLVVCRP